MINNQPSGEDDEIIERLREVTEGMRQYAEREGGKREPLGARNDAKFLTVLERQ